MRQAKGGNIATGKERADDVSAGDRQIEMRWMILVMVNCDARRARPAQMVARKSLQGINRRFIVGAFDAEGDAFAGLEQSRRWDDGNS